MQVEQRPGNHVVRDDIITLSSSLTDTGDEVSYILDDSGLQAEFGDDWEIAKVICIEFCNSVYNHRMNTHTDTDYDSLYNILHMVAIAESVRTLDKVAVRRTLEKAFGDNRQETLNRIIKVLYGGESQETQC